jgi:glutamine synthetase
MSQPPRDSPSPAGGLLTLEDLERLALRGEVDTVLVVFPDLYGRFMGKRVPARFFLDSVARAGMHACNYLLTVDMEMDVVPGYRLASWEQGYGDFHCVPDLATLRRLSWLDRSAQVICDLEMEHQPVAVAPRSILRRQLARAAAAGYRVLGASELEYYLFKETYDSARAKGFDRLEPFGWYIEDYHMLQGTKEEAFHGALRRHLEASGIPVESSKGEWGPGQHELNIRYCEALEMADRHAIYKQAAKEIALAQGVAVTFMAKWRADLAGSSMHLHLSLWDAAGERALFPGDGRLGSPSGRDRTGPLAASDAMRWFLGGWIAHARAITPFYAPYPTSYKRYVFQSWAPTNLAWSVDNRTAGFRLLGDGPALRIECRIPGADANPYLAFAASIAAGLDGIEREIEPPPPFGGDAYAAANVPKVPASLREATAEMESSDMLRAAFGEEVIAHYAHFFRVEQKKLDAVVTSWERERYFERA